jgi:large subunit ribosomal protein L29
MLKAKDLRERTLEDLKELEKSLRADMFQARLKNFTNRLDDTSSIGKARKDLARVLTTITLKSAGEAPAKPAPKAPKAALKTPAKTAAAKKAKVAKPKKTDTSSKKAKEG